MAVTSVFQLNLDYRPMTKGGRSFGLLPGFPGLNSMDDIALRSCNLQLRV